MRPSVFISVANCEFAGLRGEIRNALAGSFDVVVEPDFPASASNSIRQLDDLIRRCELLVHVVGTEPGSRAQHEDIRAFIEDEAFRRFLWRTPDARQALGDFSQLTYPQWEVWLAVNRGIPVLAFRTEGATSDRAQSAHLTNLRSASCQVRVFKPDTAFVAQIVSDTHHQINLLASKSQQSAAGRAIESANRRFKSATSGELINNVSIARSETQAVLRLLEKPEIRGVLLVAEAGGGKSCVLTQVFSELTGIVAVLAFKLDSLPECNSARKLGCELDLPSDPVTSVVEASAGQPAVLIIDQLDAVSTVSSRKTVTWDAFDEVCELAFDADSVKVLVACRSFDLEQDHRLRKLEKKDAGFEKVVLSRLTENELRLALDQARLAEFKPDLAQTDILRLPLHLTLFLQGNPSLAFSKIGDLYDRYWDRKIEMLRKTLGTAERWLNVVQTLCAWMSEHQSTTCPIDALDEWPETAQGMVSIHVLVREGNSYRFFHESFFDYAFARCFCKSGKSLLEFLTGDNEEQQLFRRAQVRQILAFRREHRPAEYLVDLRDMLGSDRVRFHIRRMVAAGLRQIDKPTSDELEIVREFLFDHDLSGTVSWAIRGNLGWFDLLDSSGTLKQWMESDDERRVDTAVWILCETDFHKARSERIAELLEPLLGTSDVWNRRYRSIFSWGIAHESRRMWDLFLRFFETGGLDGRDENSAFRGVWGRLHEAATEAPRMVIDLVAVWLDRTARLFDDGESWNFFDQCDSNSSDEGARAISEAAKAEPDYFLEALLPKLAEIIQKTMVSRTDRVLNRAWPYLSSRKHAFDVNDAVLLELWRQLCHLATANPQKLRDSIASFRDQPHETFGYLILEAYSANPEQFAEECASYMLEHHPRFYIGYGSWSGDGHGESAISRRAIEAITPFCFQATLDKLEDAIVNQCDEFEKSHPEQRGLAEYLLLQAIVPPRRSNRVKVRISELECKYRNVPVVIPEDDFSSLARGVGSPIPIERLPLMTDDQWISAMTKYDGTTDRFEGGPIELSRALCDLVPKDRHRFAALTGKMPDSILEVYFAAILDGLTGGLVNRTEEDQAAVDKELATVPTNLFVDVINRLHSLPNRPCGKAIVRCIQKLADRELPEALLAILAWYAVNDPDPQTELWQVHENGQLYYDGDPYSFGINTVRGQAAEAIEILLFKNHDRWAVLECAVRSMVSDGSVAVRVCTINAIMPLLNFDIDAAIGLFIQCCEGEEAIWVSHPFGQFIHYAIHTHFAQLENLLRAVLSSTQKTAIESVSTQVTLAGLCGVDVGDLAVNTRVGTETMRKAACHVYAANINDKKVGDRAADLIRIFFDDPSEEVRKQIGIAFWKMDGERLFELENLLLAFVNSPAFVENADHLLSSLDESRAQLPRIVCRAAERILDTVGDKGASFANRGALAARTISTLVVRQYTQTTDPKLKRSCLDLIDQMERIGYWGVGEELKKLDR